MYVVPGCVLCIVHSLQGQMGAVLLPGTSHVGKKHRTRPPYCDNTTLLLPPSDLSIALAERNLKLEVLPIFHRTKTESVGHSRLLKFRGVLHSRLHCRFGNLLLVTA
jgi:hypothetical protein